MSDEDKELAGVDTGSATVVTHTLNPSMKDKYVYYVSPGDEKCPKCGTLASVSKGECQACGCWVGYDKDRAGKKELFKGVAAMPQKRQKPQKAQAVKPVKKPRDEDEEEDDGQEPEEDDDFQVEVAKVKPVELATALLKKAKAMLKESAEMIGQFYTKVEITFEPFMMKAQQKATEL